MLYTRLYFLYSPKQAGERGEKPFLFVFWNMKGGVLVDFKVCQALLRLNYEKKLT